MRRIHRLMTLHFGAGAGTRVISRELGIAHSTVREYLGKRRDGGALTSLRSAIAGLQWLCSE
jgi:DNA-binding transcriptional regulator LsrR (DeoR family)